MYPVPQTFNSVVHTIFPCIRTLLAKTPAGRKMISKPANHYLISKVYASIILFGRPNETTADDLVKIDAASLGNVTLVVGRELRCLDMQQMRGTDFRYSMEVHSHFTTAREIEASKLKIIMSDSSGSSLLIHGPYASTVEAAIAALESDLVSKLRDISAEPGKAAQRGWFSKAPTQGIGGGPPGLRCTTGPGANVKVVAPDVANKEAAEAEEKGARCPREYVQVM